MKVKERFFETYDWGYPPVRNYQIGAPLGWDSKNFPLVYYESRTPYVPDLIDYFHQSVLFDDKRFWMPDKPANGYERIEYGTGKEKFNFCAHNVSREYIHSFGFKARNAAHPDYVTVYPNYRSGPQAAALRQALVSFGGPIRDMSARAFWTMRPKFEGSIDLMSFVLESTDFIRVASIFKSILNSSAHKMDIWRKRHNIHRNASFSDASKVTLAASKAWLSFNLEWAPLLQDFNDILENLRNTVDAAQKKFSMQGEFGNVKHYSENIATIDKRSQVTNFPYKGWFSLGLLEREVFTATADFRYDYQIRPDCEAFLKYWKLGGSFETMWEQTRLSFVVDYFVKIGKAISAMEVDENVTNVTAVKYCESVKATYGYGAWADPNGENLIDLHVNGSRVDHVTMVSGSINQAYVRMPSSLYKGLYIPLAAKPKFRQKVTLVALARSMMS